MGGVLLFGLACLDDLAAVTTLSLLFLLIRTLANSQSVLWNVAASGNVS